VALTGLLKEGGRAADVDRLLRELAGNLCRCTGYLSIRRAVGTLRRSPG
jgi:aerobic-type carbon monoxide dehydrogenase small subunit (CoxS/CutS family)